MLETFTVEKFSPHVGDTFRVVFNDTSLEVTLDAVTPYGSESAKEWSKASGRVPFSMIFLGPLDRVIQQGIYRFEHDEMEPFEIFLVPIGPNPQGMRYEVIFT